MAQSRTILPIISLKFTTPTSPTSYRTKIISDCLTHPHRPTRKSASALGRVPRKLLSCVNHRKLRSNIISSRVKAQFRVAPIRVRVQSLRSPISHWHSVREHGRRQSIWIWIRRRSEGNWIIWAIVTIVRPQNPPCLALACCITPSRPTRPPPLLRTIGSNNTNVPTAEGVTVERINIAFNFRTWDELHSFSTGYWTMAETLWN